MAQLLCMKTGTNEDFLTSAVMSIISFKVQSHILFSVSKYFSALLKFLFPNIDYNAAMWLPYGYSICIRMHLFAVLFIVCVFYISPVSMWFSFYVRM